MSEMEIITTAIETNIRTLIKSHPQKKNFIETLRNEAIDQAFQELHEDNEEIHRELNELFKEVTGINTIYSSQSNRLAQLRNQISVLEQTKKKE